ncbi:MAG: TRAP transporter substrate-binding protein DctP [Gammaproteobacteria bacterium]|nr:TRAP transporter substrate-binding protein DctP [Gammaproteobacteria bacterium]
MQRFTITATAALFLAGAMALGTAHAMTFKIATIAPDGTQWMTEMRAAAKEISSRTEGRVDFKFYPGGVMGSDKSVLRKMRIGQLHGAAFSGGGLADVYPNSRIYGLPLLFKDEDEVDYVRARMDEVFSKGLEDAGFVNFGIAEGGFALLMSSIPIRDTDDLKDKKTWVPEGDVVSYEALKALGVAPVLLPLTDVLTGLQTGLVSTVATPPSGAIAFQWHTKIKHVTDLPVAYTYGVFVIDKRTFQKLSDADQAVVREILNDLFRRFDKLNREANYSARQALIDNEIEFVEPDAATLQVWQDISNEVIENLGGESAFDIKLAKDVQALVREYRSRQ